MEQIVRCNFENSEHVHAFLDLLQHYMEDPMGDYPVHDEQKNQQLIEGLAGNEKAFVVFVCVENQFVGMSTCFELFSTFQVKPYVYVHDVVIRRDFRGRGLGRVLLLGVESIAREIDACKVTLEVRTDNPVAQSLYSGLGFAAGDPEMLFWYKLL